MLITLYWVYRTAGLPMTSFHSLGQVMIVVIFVVIYIKAFICSYGPCHDFSWRCFCNHRTSWNFTCHREHLTDPNEGLTDTQIRLGKQVSQVKVSYLIKILLVVFLLQFDEKVTKTLCNWRCYRQKRKGTSEWSWVTIIRTKSFSGKNGCNSYVCFFYQVFF